MSPELIDIWMERWTDDLIDGLSDDFDHRSHAEGYLDPVDPKEDEDSG